MKNSDIRRYRKNAGYSYTIGVFPTLELLTHRPTAVTQVILHSRSSKNTGAAKIQSLCSKKGIPVTTSDRLIARLAGKENTYAIGIFNKFTRDIDPRTNHVVLVGIRDSGNLGTICRTMAGFGFSDLAIIKPAVDIFDPKVIRASMGALFQINVQYFDTFDEYKRLFSQHIYAFMTAGEEKLERVTFREPYALVFGSEASGLDTTIEGTGTSVRIPQSKNIDSLNLSVSVGIVLYEILRK